jgi:4-carboxymuconolactone decarboxylase
VHSGHESLGKEIHEKSGPLPEKIRWLIKIAVSAANRHPRALERHIMKARAAGVTDPEIKHALLMPIQTSCFPTFMKASSVLKGMKNPPKNRRL